MIGDSEQDLGSVARSFPKNPEMRVFLMLLLLIPGGLLAADRTPERKAFTAAWRQAQSGVDVGARAELVSYPLTPYLQYEFLRRDPLKKPFKRIEAYLSEYGDTLPGERLRADLISALARVHRHADLIAIYREDNASVEADCQAFNALGALKRKPPAALIPRILSRIDRAIAACDPPLRQAALAPQDIRARFDDAIKTDRLPLAALWAERLPAAEKLGAQRLVLARRDPQVALNAANKWPTDAAHSRAAAMAVSRLARSSAASAYERYLRIAARFPLTEADKGLALAEIARYAFVERLDNALVLSRKVPKAAVDDGLREWQVRYALRRTDYAAALEALEGMTPALAGQARWAYAKGRVQQLLGDSAAAEAAFKQAAAQANFHGFLAADQLGTPYAICPLSPLLDTERALKVLGAGGVQRSLEWLALGDRTRARAEWFWQLQKFPAELKREAGLVASREGLHEWAIFTLNGEADLRQYDARFPLLHQRTVAGAAVRTGLSKPWILGLIRAESAWNAGARSPVGARGLMQLMPATAAAVAKSLNVRVEPLDDGDHNIRLGTTYLARRLADLEGNPVLATAAYNAGIGAVKRWLGEPLPPWDLWVETIPYKETREYVARVMAFSVLYDWRIDGSPKRVAALVPGMPRGDEVAAIACPVAVAGP